MGIFFLFHFLQKGHFTCKCMESDIIELRILSCLSYRGCYNLNTWASGGPDTIA